MGAALTLLTLNCGLLCITLLGRKLLEPAPHIAERLAALPAALRGIGADIVALQEIYRPEHKRRVAAALVDAWPHAAFPEPTPALKLDSGLLVLSKFPLHEARFVPFAAAPWVEKLFVHRGFFVTRHEVPGLGPMRLLSFHTTAGGLFHDPEAAVTDAIRARQIAQMLDHAEREGDIPHLLAGDLNAGPPVSMANYRQVLERGYVDLFAAAQGDEAAARAVTWDSRQPLNQRGPHAHQRPQRIDHVFLHRRALDRFAVGDARIVLADPVVAVDGAAAVSVADHYGLAVRLAARSA